MWPRATKWGTLLEYQNLDLLGDPKETPNVCWNDLVNKFSQFLEKQSGQYFLYMFIGLFFQLLFIFTSFGCII